MDRHHQAYPNQGTAMTHQQLITILLILGVIALSVWIIKAIR
jgi:hypothetical protein